MQGKTKVALYGLGFMREERLARAFQLPGQVVWARPGEDTESWFNIFALGEDFFPFNELNFDHLFGQTDELERIQSKILDDLNVTLKEIISR